MKDNSIYYSELIDGAMRAVVREVLRDVEEGGLPGEHHFYISFLTQYPGTEVSDTLLDRYPEEMTIVLQHQFWDFHVEDQLFHVTLSFGGKPERLSVPFAALTAFADPSVKFSLQFHYRYEDEEDEEHLASGTLYSTASDIASGVGASEKGNDSEDGKAEILSFDAFKKK